MYQKTIMKKMLLPFKAVLFTTTTSFLKMEIWKSEIEVTTLPFLFVESTFLKLERIMFFFAKTSFESAAREHTLHRSKIAPTTFD